MRIAAFAILCLVLSASTASATPSKLDADARQRAVADLDRTVRGIDASLARRKRSIRIEGEDATSGFWHIAWSNRNGVVVKERRAWNGGCCGASQIQDFYFRDGKLIKRVFFVAPNNDARVRQGGEPRTRLVLGYDEYDPAGDLLRSFVDNLLLGRTTTDLFP